MKFYLLQFFINVIIFENYQLKMIIRFVIQHSNTKNTENDEL